MSSNATHEEHDDDPRFEPWLGVTVSALIPVAAAPHVPKAFGIPFIILSVVLFLAGVLMLRAQKARRAHVRDAKPVLPEPPSRSFERRPAELEGASS